MRKEDYRLYKKWGCPLEGAKRLEEVSRFSGLKYYSLDIIRGLIQAAIHGMYAGGDSWTTVEYFLQKKSPFREIYNEKMKWREKQLKYKQN